MDENEKDRDIMNKNAKQDPELAGRLIAARGGDESAFAELIREYSPLLRSVVAAYGRGLPRADLEEIGQEALLAFYSAVKSYDPLYGSVTFGLYAKLCVRNRVINAVSSIRPAPEPLPDDTDASSPSPLSEYLAKESLDELRERIRSCLSDFENTVFWQFYAGVPVSTIAAGTGRSKRSIENALYRIRTKLRRELSGRR